MCSPPYARTHKIVFDLFFPSLIISFLFFPPLPRFICYLFLWSCTWMVRFFCHRERRVLLIELEEKKKKRRNFLMAYSNLVVTHYVKERISKMRIFFIEYEVLMLLFTSKDSIFLPFFFLVSLFHEVKIGQ